MKIVYLPWRFLSVWNWWTLPVNTYVCIVRVCNIQRSYSYPINNYLFKYYFHSLIGWKDMFAMPRSLPVRTSADYTFKHWQIDEFTSLWGSPRAFLKNYCSGAAELRVLFRKNPHKSNRHFFMLFHWLLCEVTLLYRFLNNI